MIFIIAQIIWYRHFYCVHRNKYFCIQIAKIRHTGENKFKFGFEMNIFLSLQEVSKLDWSATDFGSQFPEEFRESVTRLTTFCSFSWTLSMIQHPVMSVIRYSGGLPQRTHGCSELFQPVADRHKPDLRRWFLTSESQPLFFRQTAGRYCSCPAAENYFLCHDIFFPADPICRAVYGIGLWPLACWDWGLKSRRGHGCLSLVCCHVQVSATGRSLVQGSPTEY